MDLNIYNNKKVLITGGAGFIGSNLVNELVKLGAVVTVIDDLSTGDYKNFSHPNKVDFIHLNIKDVWQSSLITREIILNQDYVFHLAARNIIISISNPIDDYDVNIGGTLHLLTLLRESTKLKRFIYASSASIYGNNKHLPISEDDGINILSPYAASKLGGENYTKVFYEQYGIPVVIVRYSNVYGVNQKTSNPYCGVIGKFIDKIINNEPINIYGNGEQTRDFTYVKDAINATLLAGAHLRAEGEVFNVATGTETNINMLANIISELLFKKFNTEYIDKRDIDNIRRRVINIDKIKSILNWEPNYTLRQGLAETIKWKQNNI